MPRGGARKTVRGRRSGLRSFRNSSNPVVSVVIPVMNERRTIAAVLRQVYRVHPRVEAIVVANGSTDGTAAIAQRMGAKVVTYPFPLGHDVGRAIGARIARGRVLLFTDGDIVIAARDLIPFVRAVEQGTDVALNKYIGPVNKFDVHSVVLAKHALNVSLSRPDLAGTSLTAVPHAVSRKTLETIGPEQLAVPPKAHAMAVHCGLQVRAVHHVDVGARNRLRRRGSGRDPVEELIVGDHLEAMHWILQHSGGRGGKTDLFRIREYAR